MTDKEEEVTLEHSSGSLSGRKVKTKKARKPLVECKATSAALNDDPSQDSTSLHQRELMTSARDDSLIVEADSTSSYQNLEEEEADEASILLMVEDTPSSVDRLMQQVHSILRDADFPQKNKFSSENFYFERCQEPESTIDHVEAVVTVSKSQVSLSNKNVLPVTCVVRSHDDAEQTRMEDKMSFDEMSDDFNGTLFKEINCFDEQEMRELFDLLHQWKDILHNCNSWNIKDETTTDSKKYENQSTVDTTGNQSTVDVTTDNQRLPTFAVDLLEKEININRVKQLLKEVTQKKFFTSVVELQEFLIALENVENQMKEKCKTDSDSNVADKKSLKEIMKILNEKVSCRCKCLSEKLIIWQDLIETKAELEHALNEERILLQSIDNNMSCNDSPSSIWNACHDLEIADESLVDCEDKLLQMRKCKRKLTDIIDKDSLLLMNAQIGIIKNDVFAARRLFCHFREKLNPFDSFKIWSNRKIEVISNEKRKTTTTAKTLNDDSMKETSFQLLKFIFFLFLLLFIFIFICFLEPCICHLFHQWRFPLPFHLRHVGTFPPL